jgi:pimeloyl-ACP methyl ester carboxylesterase
VIQYPYRVGDVVTRVLEAGARTGVPAILLHGVGARADRWCRNLPALAEVGLSGYALDLPGHGLASKGPEFDHSVAGYRDFVGAFLDAIDAERVILIGTSIGAHIQAALTCLAPERVAALIMIGPLGLCPLGPERRAAIQRSLADTSVEGIRHKLLRIMHDPAHVTAAWVTEEYHVNNSPGARESLAAIGTYIADRLDDDLAGPRLAGLDARPPTLLVWGAEDSVVPTHLAGRARTVLDTASLVTIPAAGHLPYYEAPERFNGAVEDFLHEHDVLRTSGR